MSLRSRIAVTVVLLITTVVVTTLTVAYHEMFEAMYFAIDQIVLRDAEVIRAELTSEDTDTPRDGISDLSEITHSLAGPERLRSPLYRIWKEGESGDLLASDATNTERYRALADVPLPGRKDIQKRQIVTISAGKKEYRALAMVLDVPGSSEVIHAIIASPCDYAKREIEEFRCFMLILGGTVIVVAGAISALLVYGAMRPVGVLADQLQTVTHQNLAAAKIETAAIPSDLRPFAEAVSTMLARLNKAFEQQKQFTADAAHELRSPLAVAKSTIQATLSLPETKRDYEEMARSELEDLYRMERLIEELLLLAHLEESSTPEDRIELRKLLRESINLFQESSGVSVHLDEKIPPVILQGHYEELLRLLSNLIENAVQHGPDDGTVTISATQRDESFVSVTVHDEGGNIPQEAISHLTERFYRVDTSRARETGGSGLGLAIANEIAQRHDGWIEIQSSPPKGTSVTLVIPCD